MSVSYYELLGIPNNATREEVKIAATTLKAKWSPQEMKKWASEEQYPICRKVFARIMIAEMILCDAEARAEYDMQLANLSDEDPDEELFAQKWRSQKQIYEAHLEKEKLANANTFQMGLFAGEGSDKLKADGLKTIYRMIIFFSDDYTPFYSVKLVFENVEKAIALNNKLIECFKEKDINPFTLEKDPYIEKEGTQYIFEMSFTVQCEDVQKQGEMLLSELEKYVDIRNIPQEYRNSIQNMPLDENLLREELVSSKKVMGMR